MAQSVRRRTRPQIFLSHSSQDTWVATQIANHLRRAGATPFLDVFDIDHGQDYDDVIRRATVNSHEALILLTGAAARSNNVWMEVGAFWGQGKNVTCVLYGVTIASLSKDPKIPAFVKRGQHVGINDIDGYFKKLTRRIARRKKAR